MQKLRKSQSVKHGPGNPNSCPTSLQNHAFVQEAAWAQEDADEKLQRDQKLDVFRDSVPCWFGF